MARFGAAQVIPFSCAALLFSATVAHAGAVEESRGEWVTQLQWFVLLALAIGQLIGLWRRKPPLEVEFLRREEADKRLQRITEKIDGIRVELRSDMGSISRKLDEQETRFIEIYDRLGQLRRREPVT